jgi:RNA polymerase sigma factor (sigma-70 family)
MIEWPAIVRQYSPLVWRTIYRLLPHEADAADCFQEVFVSAWKVAARQPVQNWAGLLQTLATARAIDQLRRLRRQSMRMETGTDWNELPSADAEPGQVAESRELAERLRLALLNLPDQQRMVYSLRHLSGMTYEQIAAELDISVNGVGVALHRAGERLRELLQTEHLKPR